MKKIKIDIIDRILILVLLLSIWAILTIQLNWIPFITISWGPKCIDATSVNAVFINLSYSYIAALLFYGLTTRLTAHRRKKMLMPVIQRRVRELGKDMCNILLEFSRETEFGHDYRNIADTEAILRSKDWMAIMPEILKYRNVKISYLNYLNAVSKVFKDKISSVIQLYKDEMTEEQLVKLEELSNSSFFHQVEFLCSIILGSIEEGGYNSLISDFCKMQKTYLEVERLFDIE